MSMDCICNLNGGVIASAITSDAVEVGVEPQFGQSKDYKVSICCFSIWPAAFRSKTKYWLGRK